MKRKVVVTGMGAITPIGNDVNTMWSGIKNCICGIDKITSFDCENFKAKLAAEVKGFKPDEYMDKKEARRMDRFSQFAVAASLEAMVNSGLNLDEIDRERMGVVIGCGIGGMLTIEKEHENYMVKGASRVSPFYIPMAISNMAAGNVAIRFKAKGISLTVVTACASGSNAIGEAMRVIERGDADIMIAGGTEAAITPLSMSGFINMNALSTSTDKNRACIPFDKEREGFVMGEGSGMLILESEEFALKRGAKIYAELAGYGATCDAYHITSPAPDGEGGARAMLIALKDANLNIEDISYINAHGTGTHYNDKFETAAIKEVFKDCAYKIPVSSTKSNTGHLLGAAGAVEAVISIKAICDNFIPPTINYREADEECDLDCVPNNGREAKVNNVLSNSLGFGGHNATLIFKKYE